MLIEQAPHLLAPFSEHSRRYARKVLEARGVEVRLDTAVTVGGGRPPHLRRRHHRCAAGWCCGRPGVKASTLVDGLEASRGRGGRIVVGPDLSIPGHPDAYAIGDVADIDDGQGGRLPQLAQVAIQGGAHAADQILATIARRPRTPFRYHDKGTMATIGRRAAVAELPVGLNLTGAGGLVGLAGSAPRVPDRRAQPGVGGPQLGLELLHLGPRPAPDPAPRGAAPLAPPAVGRPRPGAWLESRRTVHRAHQGDLVAATAEQINATIDRYVAAFSAGDKDGYLAVFAPGATVEDPVGSEVCTGAEAIAGFWDGVGAWPRPSPWSRPGSPRIAAGEAAWTCGPSPTWAT